MSSSLNAGQLYIDLLDEVFLYFQSLSIVTYGWRQVTVHKTVCNKSEGVRDVID